MMMERSKCITVRWHCVVSKESAYNLPQPFPLLRDRQMFPPLKFLLDLLEFRSHAVAPRLPAKQELALSRLATDEGESQKIDSLRLAKPAFCALMSRITAEHD